jgi:uncharacterized repeat protein (TIGR02543 family)
MNNAKPGALRPAAFFCMVMLLSAGCKDLSHPEEPEMVTVTFDAAGGSPGTQTRKITKGASPGSPNMPSDPVRTGYTFDGWYTSTGGSGSRFTPSAAVNSNGTVYARWIPVAEYAINYALNGGSYARGTPWNYTTGSLPVTLIAPTRPGYDFGGWYNTADFSGEAVTRIPPGSTGDKDFYARWESSGAAYYDITRRPRDTETETGSYRYAAVRDTLAVLPFTGGGTQDEGETLAELFSFSAALNDAFVPIPRAGITRAVSSDQKFQTGAGMTDPEAIAALGRQLGAAYVAAGNIARLGNHKLLIISIFKTDDLRQIGGDIQAYTQIGDIQDKLPDMARNIIRTARAGSFGLEKLAVVPVEPDDGIDADVAGTLAQLLSINIIRSGRYAVYPRTAALEQAQEEYKTRLNGSTEDESMVDTGRGDTPALVLSAAVRRLDALNMFNASIISLESGVQRIEGSEGYNTLDDGIRAMEKLSRKLTGLSEVPGVSGNPSSGDDPEAVRNGTAAAADNRTGQPAAGQPAWGEKTAKKSGGNAFGYGVLNLAAGLGSFVQGDWGGGLICVLGYGAAAGLILWEVSAFSYEDELAGIPGTAGLGVAGVTALFGFIRPVLYKKNLTLAGIMDRIHLTVVPGNEGGETVRLSYSLNFERRVKYE